MGEAHIADREVDIFAVPLNKATNNIMTSIVVIELGPARDIFPQPVPEFQREGLEIWAYRRAGAELPFLESFDGLRHLFIIVSYSLSSYSGHMTPFLGITSQVVPKR